MKDYTINQIKNIYWKIETINQKHRVAHLAAEIYYCAHIFIGFIILLLKLEFFNSFNEIFVNPPVWLGILFPLLTFGKYSISYISVIAPILCFIMVPAVLSVMVYLLFSISFKNKDSIDKNPYKKLRDNDVLERIFQTTPSCFKVLKVLENRIHVLVWIQVATCVALLLVFMIYGLVQKMILPEEIGLGLVCVVFVCPSSCICFYILRWIERRLYAPIYKLLNVIYLKRIGKRLDDVRQSKLYINYIDAKNAKSKARAIAEEKARRAEEIKKKEIAERAKKYAKESPVFIDDIMRIVKNNDKSDSNTNKDSLGYEDGVHVDGTGI